MIAWTKFAEKGYFQLKTEKVNIPTEFCIFELASVPNLTLKNNFDFWTQFVQKGYFQSKLGKVNIAIEFCILELVLDQISA